jgi:glycosyltransferase involved in cell wall biosynthesis
MSHMGSINTLLAEEAHPAARGLKVLQVGKFYPPHKGGIESHLQALCDELRKSLDVRVLVASDDQHTREEVVDKIAVSRIATRLTVSSAPICPGMISRIRESRADIVHLHWPNPTAVLAYLASKHRGRLVVTYHSDTVRQPVLSTLFEPFLHSALRRSSAIITTSPDYLRTSPILSRYQARCHVIPLGIDLDEFQHVDPAAVATLRQKYGDRLILSVGRMVYYKGFEYLIRAMKQVHGKLLLIGGGPLEGELRQLVSSLALNDKVFLLGEVQGKLVSYYKAADVFVLPSVARTEAFGIVQIEAMAAGKPVVNTRLDSGVPFVSVHEQTGLTVPPADAGAMAAAINRLLDDPDLCARFGRAATVRARQEFSLDRMASRTVALYQQVACAPGLCRMSDIGSGDFRQGQSIL